MPNLTDDKILSIIGSELSQSSGSEEIDSNRQAALGYYLGHKNGKEAEGRSSVVSTDVADAIEWILPEVIKAFTQNNEVVTFDACSSGDEDQAELESKYVYDILMKDNNGFLVIHQFIKDALLQKNGFIKVFYEKTSSTSTESYTGLNPLELEVLMSDETLEITGLDTREVESPASPNGVMEIFDVNVSRTSEEGKVNVIAVPPEEFRVNKMHNSVDLSTARFTAHTILKTASDLVESGLSKEEVDSIRSTEVSDDDRQYRFYMQGESSTGSSSESSDASMRLIEVSECYMRIDINQDGIAELCKITVAGGDNPTMIIDWEEIEEIPFISATAILMSHKLFGLSIYDRLKQIQDQKTTLWRNIFDNMYLQNNQRTVVVENQVNIDDLLVSRPGGIIRAKVAGAVQPYITPPLSGDSYKMMDYLDQVRAGRTGVSPEGPVTDSMVGDRVGSQGIAQMMSQKEELVGLMIRVFAETGIKPLCYMIRSQVIRHQDVASEYKHRGSWVEVNPKHWDKRSNTTVRVGTGSGNRQEQSSAISQIMMMQEKILMNPSQSLVTEAQIYNALNDFAKFSGMTGVDKYLMDPKSPEGQENKKAITESSQKKEELEVQERTAMAEAQAKIAQAALGEAEASAENVKLKAEVDSTKNQLVAQKQESDLMVKAVQQELEELKAISQEEQKSSDLAFRYYDADQRAEVERERIAVAARQAESNKNNDGGNNES